MRTMFGRLGPSMARVVALAVTALAAAPSARAAELKEVHIDVGSSGAPLVATVHVEDYRAAPLDLLTPAATHDSSMTRFLKTYNEVAKAGDVKKFVSLFAADVGAEEDSHHTPQSLREQFADLRSVRLSAVLHWGELQFGFVQCEAADGEGGTRRWTWAHAARCVGGSCQIIGHFKNSLLGRIVTTAFAVRGGAQIAVPPGSETLPILPAVADASKQAVATDPIVLYLNRSSDTTTRAASTIVSTLTDKLSATSPKQATFEQLAGLYSAGTPSTVEVFQLGNDVSAYTYGAYIEWYAKHAPWTVDSVYSLGPDLCVALLRSNKDRALHLLPLQRAAKGWTIISDPSSLDAWMVLSSISSYQALQNR